MVVKNQKHSSSTTNIGGKIIGAHASVCFRIWHFFAEIMSIGQIQRRGTRVMKGGSPAHKNFDDQMVKNRLLTGLVKH